MMDILENVTLNKNEAEKGIDLVADAAFQAGYMKALRDILDKTNGKVTSEVARILIEKSYINYANEFVKAHPFKFITK